MMGEVQLLYSLLIMLADKLYTVYVVLGLLAFCMKEHYKNTRAISCHRCVSFAAE